MTSNVECTPVPVVQDIWDFVGLEVKEADVAALIAEVDAIFCAAPVPVRRAPAPPVTGCALMRPGRPVGLVERCPGAWQRPTQSVRAVQRSPPRS
jgi:hypothetical protein